MEGFFVKRKIRRLIKSKNAKCKIIKVNKTLIAQKEKSRF